LVLELLFHINIFLKIQIFPNNIFISHNHSDHSGELPLILMVEYAKGKKFNIFSAAEVQERLIKHRIHEVYSIVNDYNRFANWITCSIEKEQKTQINDNFSISLLPSKHQELFYGFILYYKQNAILGFTGDSGFDTTLYNSLSEASTIICDGRETGTSEHASFKEITDFETSINMTKKVIIYVTHYGCKIDKPDKPKPLEIGKSVKLWPVSNIKS